MKSDHAVFINPRPQAHHAATPGDAHQPCTIASQDRSNLLQKHPIIKHQSLSSPAPHLELHRIPALHSTLHFSFLSLSFHPDSTSTKRHSLLLSSVDPGNPPGVLELASIDSPSQNPVRVGCALKPQSSRISRCQGRSERSAEAPWLVLACKKRLLTSLSARDFAARWM